MDKFRLELINRTSRDSVDEIKGRGFVDLQIMYRLTSPECLFWVAR